MGGKNTPNYYFSNYLHGLKKVLKVLANTSKQNTGKAGEWAAHQHLEQLGFCVLHNNWRHGHAEVDIIASKNGVLHFVEVKTRRSQRFGYPEAQVNAAKLNKLKEAAEGFLYAYPQWINIQFDIVSVYQPVGQPPQILVIEDVF
ncbi:MAG: YraN family protein [Bacteroidetes bacterium]|nr:MAG: YraN family protein [Bacteroidota bacterium]